MSTWCWHHVGTSGKVFQHPADCPEEQKNTKEAILFAHLKLACLVTVSRLFINDSTYLYPAIILVFWYLKDVSIPKISFIYKIIWMAFYDGLDWSRLYKASAGCYLGKTCCCFLELYGGQPGRYGVVIQSALVESTSGCYITSRSTRGKPTTLEVW